MVDIVKLDIEVVGDTWCNKVPFEQQLAQLPAGTKLELNLKTEGPCLDTLRITAVINQWLTKHNQTAEDVTLCCWSNGMNNVPYKLKECNSNSHFWSMGFEYWPEKLQPVDQDAQLFGLFLGRTTIPRNIILYQTAHEFGKHTLLSRMKNRRPEPWDLYDPNEYNADNIDEWQVDIQPIVNWFKNCPVTSIDNKSVRDQYGSPTTYAVCPSSLLNHYHQFQIEIVCETYTRGRTFFPTEKIVRPIVGAKPFILYGPVGFLEQIRKLGFQTFSSLWNENYDQLEGAERWTNMKHTIQHIIDNPDLVPEAQRIAAYNRQHLRELIGHRWIY